ncbi:MFS transporter [Amycolatopsis sp. K13G38]|uniref:MFS transporter n=1 Tax=Amycolatopsis acididurans TaxID=2724524 RepID=A0ABX1J1D3_9PSEU|nr:MFS transporter [Amycolatopsis acididurans]NKQ52160.1 MFS transporter [Amycolatopsis acididurans]
MSRKPGNLVLFLTCAGQFMVILDVSVVNVALPSIRASLGFSAPGLQWVVNAYALAFGGFLLLGGRIADLYGRKRIFLLGLGVFSAASLAGGLAGTAGLLIAARAVQGLGAAVLAPATLTIVSTTFTDPDDRARALSIWTAVGAAGGAAGALVGGVLTQYLSWRSILLVNVPIGAVAIALAAPVLTESRPIAERRRLDVPGAVLVTVGGTALVYGIEHPWPWLVIGLALLALFLVVEARSPAPLMPLRLFRVRGISAGTFAMLLMGAAFITMWYFLSLYMQNTLHYNALETGAGFLPHTLAIIVGSRSAPWLRRRLGTRTLVVAGAVIGAAGFVWQGLTPPGGYLATVFGPAILMCGGLGLLMTPVTATVTSSAASDDAGLASGLLNAARQVGGAVGLAALAAAAPQSAFLASAAVLGALVVVAFAL